MGIEAALVAGGLGLAGSFLSSRATESAADTAASAQLASSQAAIDEQRRQFDLVWGSYEPYRQAGYNALAQLTGVDYTRPGATTGPVQTIPDDQLMAYLADTGGGGTQPVNALAPQTQTQAQAQEGWWVPMHSTQMPFTNEIAYSHYKYFGPKDINTLQVNNIDQAVWGASPENQPNVQSNVYGDQTLVAKPQSLAGGITPGGTRGPTYINPDTGLPTNALPGSVSPTATGPVTYPAAEGVPAGGIDPTGGSEQYVNALAGLDPTLAGRVNTALGMPEGTDPLNALYLWQQQQGEQAINRAMAARGKYNSGAATQELSDFNRALAAEEAQRIYGRAVDEYNRQYGQQADLFNLTNELARLRYGKVMDILGLGTGALGAQSNAALQTGQGIASQYLNQGNALANQYLQQGQAQAGFFSGLGGLPGNALATQYYWNQLQPNMATDTSWANWPGY